MLHSSWPCGHISEGARVDRAGDDQALQHRHHEVRRRQLANPDATPIRQAETGVWDYGTYSYFPPDALMLAMTYMYNGHREFGLELARTVWHNLICLQGYTWDMPNIMRGDVDTGERTFGNDYYQDMMLWSLPAAIDGKDLSAPAKPGGLVDRVIRAAGGRSASG